MFSEELKSFCRQLLVDINALSSIDTYEKLYAEYDSIRGQLICARLSGLMSTKLFEYWLSRLFRSYELRSADIYNNWGCERQ